VDRVTGTYEVRKADDEHQIVLGWATIAIAKDGTTVVDAHGDTIAVEELELAAYDFVLSSRASGQDHDADYAADGALVESVVFTDDKLTAWATDPATGTVDHGALDVLKSTLPRGWWVGFHIADPAAYARAKTSHTAFSIEGTAASREAVS